MPSFAKRLERCDSTVFSDTCSVSAIWRLVKASAISLTTSSSRGVSGSSGSARPSCHACISVACASSERNVRPAATVRSASIRSVSAARLST